MKKYNGELLKIYLTYNLIYFLKYLFFLFKMISELKSFQNNLNPEILESIEKTMIKSSLISKEQKEKSILEIYQTFIQRLSFNLNDQNSIAISDLIFDKSYEIYKITEKNDWPNLETFKLPNLHRLTNLFYIYIKSRLKLINKEKKMNKNKSIFIKACENIIKLLIALIDNSLLNHLQNNLLYMLFKDLFEFYHITNYNDKIKDSLEELFSLYEEETNISGLAKMNSIDENAERNFFLGSLLKIFQFKIDIINNNKEINLTEIENIYKHEKTLKNLCFFADCDLVWTYQCYLFINKKYSYNEFEVLNKLIDTGKIYHSFAISSSYGILNLVDFHINLIKTLMVILLVFNHIKLDKNILSKLTFKDNEINFLANSTYKNLTSIKKMLKQNVNKYYEIYKFGEKIMKRLEEENKDIETEKYSEIILPKSESLLEINQDYLKSSLVEGDRKYNELIKNLE